MTVTEFDIDGFISEGWYDNRYVKSYLSSAGKNPVVCHVFSGGGNFMIALNIMDEFARHGNVTVDISGCAASAATIIGLKAACTRISNTSFYLIHKVMSYVEAWGNMNEDQIQDMIDNLEKEKDENAKMTLVLAKAYSEKSGKPVADILALMKEEKWLTADEAKEWGFVDEVYNGASKFNVAGLSEKFNMMGLPVLPDGGARNAQDKFVEKVIAGIRNIFPALTHGTSADVPDNHVNINQIEMKNFEKVNGVLGVTSLNSADGKGVVLNESQLQALETAVSDRDAKICSLKPHEANYNAAMDRLNALHPDIEKAVDVEAKVNVLREKLAEIPGVAPSGAKGGGRNEGDGDGVNWDLLNSLSHMQPKEGELV